MLLIGLVKRLAGRDVGVGGAVEIWAGRAESGDGAGVREGAGSADVLDCVG